MNPVLFDDETRLNLLPFTFTRPVAWIRFGILTLREKWELKLGVAAGSLTEKYLSAKFPCTANGESVYINGSVIPGDALVAAIKKLKRGTRLVKDGVVLAIVPSGLVGS